MFYLIVICAVVGLGLIGWGWMQTRAATLPSGPIMRINKMEERRKGPSEDAVRREEEKDFARREEERAAEEQRVRSDVNHLPSVTRAVSSLAWLSRLETDLMQVKSRWRASELLAFSVVLALMSVIMLQHWGFLPPLSILIGVACLFLPWGYVKVRRAAYYRKFDEQLADTLMLMSNGLRAGFSFLQAMEMVAREARPPIGDEFGRVTQEIAVGVPIPQALNNLSGRIKSMDLQLLVTAVLIQREVGGGLAEILETIASVIRDRMRIKREIKVLTTQGRATGAILGVLPLSLGLMIHITNKLADPLSPSFVQPLLDTAFGRNLLMVGFALQCIGIAVIMKIVSIRV